ncbi:MAG TPA: hypothetical protein VNX46_03115, partial [Candidatus Acidoferrum sp.]|nr:hypothetical protein [Candidatus Acidoferrum sp.]
WMSSADTKSIPERSRMTHSLSYAAFAATAMMLTSHTTKEVAAFRRFMIERATAAAEDIDKNVYVNAFIEDVITAFKAEEIPPECFRLKKTPMENTPGHPEQGSWESVELYMEPNSVIHHLHIHKRQAGLPVPLKYNDLRDQLSKFEWWVKSPPGEKLRKRFGPKGNMTTMPAWGFHLDLHPLGLQDVSDEAYQKALSERSPTIEDIGPIFKDGDPRKGPLFEIVHGVEKYEQKQ